MAVTRAGNVIRVAADNDTVAGPLEIVGIRYIAGTGSPSASIKADSSSGVVVWETAATTDVCDQLYIRADSLHVDMAGTGTLVYIYTK